MKRRDLAIRMSLGLGMAAVLAASIAPAAVQDSGGSHAYREIYGRLLETHTRAVPGKVGTRVDYRGLLEEPRWKEMVAQLGEVDPQALETRSERLAFWINAYNVFAIDLVLGRYPVESIRDIGSIFSPVWDKEAGWIAGRAYSLGEIEHEILRPMGEPRIHAAMVCASISCPNLRREPFEAARLDVQLDEQFREWLANPEKGSRLERGSMSLTLSKILDWFAEDFEAKGGVLAFVQPYLPKASRSWIEGQPGTPDLSYFDYDWNLNE